MQHPARPLLERTLPLLERLGDFIGNGDIDPDRPGSLGTRCDLIGDIKDFLEAVQPCGELYSGAFTGTRRVCLLDLGHAGPHQ